MIFSILVLVCCMRVCVFVCCKQECEGEWNFDKSYQFKHQSNIVLNSQYSCQRQALVIRGSIAGH